ncbi:hypothetical protein V5799_006861 [Amblyomma americanum]|uniref:Cyclin-like domain-containing protein n=1 Tax=Amblyomma americanum TaxID=6943 RepID=A0AAQ4DV63_AMBAM
MEALKLWISFRDKSKQRQAATPNAGRGSTRLALESAERLDSAVRALHPNPAEESDFGRRNTTSNRNSGSRLWTYWATQPTRRVLDIDSDIGVDDPGEFDFCSEYTKNYYAYMFSKEKKWPIMPSFMALQGGLKPETRARCVEELIKLHSAMRFIPETLFRAVSIMDHYIQECIIAKHKIDLLWKASLFVAAKLEERQNTKWRLDFINYINRVQGTKKAELFDMERDILLTLNWNLSWPLALNFLRRNCKAAQASREEELTAKFILEVCLVDYRMAWAAPMLGPRDGIPQWLFTDDLPAIADMDGQANPSSKRGMLGSVLEVQVVSVRASRLLLGDQDSEASPARKRNLLMSRLYTRPTAPAVQCEHGRILGHATLAPPFILTLFFGYTTSLTFVDSALHQRSWTCRKACVSARPGIHSMISTQWQRP